MSPRELKPADVVERVRQHAEVWSAAVRSTDPADKARAERAITTLYRVAGRPEPQILWVASPGAGMLAAGLAGQSHRWIVGDYIRGDIGNGDNQHWNALAEPFDLEPKWRGRLEERVVDRLDRFELGRPADRIFGVNGLSRIGGQVRAAAAARREELRTPRDTASTSGDAIDVVVAMLLGSSWDAIVNAVGLDVARGLIVDSVRSAVQGTVDRAAGSREAVRAMQPGQFDVRTPILAAIRDCFGEPLALGEHQLEREAQIDARLDLIRSAGPWWALDGIAIVSERPLVVSVDDRGRPHAEAGPALAWPDGMELWAWHGVRVEPWIVTEPGRITVETIDKEANAEIKRVLIERFGHDRLIRDGDAELVHEDETGKLWRRRLGPEPRFGWPHTDEPIVMVEVLNSTPEPDGTRKTYFLRVPPTMPTARDAVAWTFGLSGEGYQPAHES